jgi:antitoxin component YwqK of YwqJK toxin-antitoxin module
MAFPNFQTLAFDIESTLPDISLPPLDPDHIIHNKTKNLYSYSDHRLKIYYEGQISNGKRNGFGVEFYSPRQPKISGYFLNDSLQGSLNKVFSEFGETIFVGQFENREPILGIVYYPNSAMRFAGQIKNWKVHGERVYFFYEDASLKCVGKFMNGQPDDDNLQIFHRNGVTWFKGYCKPGGGEGRASVYHNQLKFASIGEPQPQDIARQDTAPGNPFDQPISVSNLPTWGTNNGTTFSTNTSLRRYNCYELIKSLEDNVRLYELDRESQLIKLFEGSVKNGTPDGQDIKINYLNGKLNMQADFLGGEISGKVLIHDFEGRKVFEGRSEGGVLKDGRWENWGQKIGGFVDDEGLLRNFSELDNSKLYLYDLRVELKFDWRHLYHCQSYYNNSYLRILDPVDLNVIYEGFHRQKRFHGYGRYCLRSELVLEGNWNMEKLSGIAKDGQWHCKVENMPLNIADSGGFFGHGIKDFLHGFGRLYNFQRGKLLFQGNLKNGKKDGSFCMVKNFRGNIVYIGSMENDKYDGRGT